MVYLFLLVPSLGNTLAMLSQESTTSSAMRSCPMHVRGGQLACEACASAAAPKGLFPLWRLVNSISFFDQTHRVSVRSRTHQHQGCLCATHNKATSSTFGAFVVHHTHFELRHSLLTGQRRCVQCHLVPQKKLSPKLCTSTSVCTLPLTPSQTDPA